MESPKNKNKVPWDQWNSWNNQERYVFNELYEYALDNQHFITHPRQQRIPDEFWKTTAWNTAWLAADYVRDIRIHNESVEND